MERHDSAAFQAQLALMLGDSRTLWWEVAGSGLRDQQPSLGSQERVGVFHWVSGGGGCCNDSQTPLVGFISGTPWVKTLFKKLIVVRAFHTRSTVLANL